MLIHLLFDIIFSLKFESITIICYLNHKNNLLFSFCIGLLYDVIFTSFIPITAIAFFIITYINRYYKNYFLSLTVYKFIIFIILFTYGYTKLHINIRNLLIFYTFNLISYYFFKFIKINR